MSEHDHDDAAAAADGGAGGAPSTATPAMTFGSQMRMFGYEVDQAAFAGLQASVAALRSNAQLYKA